MDAITIDKNVSQTERKHRTMTACKDKDKNKQRKKIWF